MQPTRRPSTAAAAAAPVGWQQRRRRAVRKLVLVMAAVAVLVFAVCPASATSVVAEARGGDCPHVSHQFQRIPDDAQRALALRTREALGGKPAVLMVGGFGGSGTRAWASLFHFLAPDQLHFARGNGDWDAGFGSTVFSKVFPKCKAGLREYFDYSATREHMARRRQQSRIEEYLLPGVAGKNDDLTPGAAQAWGFKQPDAIADIPHAVAETDNVVGVVVLRDPRDLLTRPFMHSTPDGTHLGSHDNLCGKTYRHLECDWHKADLKHLPHKEQRIVWRREQTPQCVAHGLDVWAAVHGFLKTMAERQCAEKDRPVQQLFLGRSEDLVDMTQRDAVVGMAQHILASLGVVQTADAIEAAIETNPSRHRPGRKNSPTYGRWREHRDRFDFDAVLAETRDTLVRFAYDAPPRAGAVAEDAARRDDL